MSFKDSNTAKSALGNQAKYSPNTKGTGTVHVPSGIALRGKDFALAATVNPDTDGNRVPGRFMDDPPGATEGSAQVPNTFTQSKFSLPAVVNPSGDKDRSKKNVAPKA